MRDAMAAALRDKRFDDLSTLDNTTIRIDNSRKYTPMGKRIYNRERPSDIIGRCAEAKNAKS